MRPGDVGFPKIAETNSLSHVETGEYAASLRNGESVTRTYKQCETELMDGASTRTAGDYSQSEAEAGSTGESVVVQQPSALLPVRSTRFRCSKCKSRKPLSFAYVTDAEDGRKNVGCG